MKTTDCGINNHDIREMLVEVESLRLRAEAYDDAVAALAEVDGGAPLSTTIGNLIRNGYLGLRDPEPECVCGLPRHHQGGCRVLGFD
jgi:hypothetical protein